MAAAYNLEYYMRYLERRSNNFNRGASQETIERFTFPHKYKKVSKMFLITFEVYVKLICCVLLRDLANEQIKLILGFSFVFTTAHKETFNIPSIPRSKLL